MSRRSIMNSGAKLVSLNVNGMNNLGKMGKVWEKFTKEGIEVIFFFFYKKPTRNLTSEHDN